MNSFQNKIRCFVFVVFMGVFVFSVYGQHHEENHSHLHDHHKYHLGFGVAGTYLTTENGLAPGFHVHFIRQLGEEQHWGIGLWLRDNY